MSDDSRMITFACTNWRGERSVRLVTPERLWFGATKFHPQPQWLLRAFDHGKQEVRDFALVDMDFTNDSGAEDD